MAKGDCYLVYADEDEVEIKIHGPLSAEQAEGFYSGAEWVNASGLEYLGVHRGIEAAREVANEQVRTRYTDYEVVEMGFEVPQLEVSQGELYLLYLDSDYDVLKIAGPLLPGQAEGFYSGVEWVNDSALEYLGIYAGAEVAMRAAQEYGEGAYPIEEMEFASGRLPTLDL